MGLKRNFQLILFCTCLGFSILANAIASHGNYTLCFTPNDNCTELITHQIQSATSSIYVQAYSFTSQPIAAALSQAHAKGINVAILVDKSQRESASYSVAHQLARQGIPIWVDYRPAIAHNKVMVIDKRTVITGSFNFTASAQKRNAENVIIINDPWVAAQYVNNWQQRQRVSAPFKPAQAASWFDQLLNWLQKQLNKLVIKELRHILGN